MYLLHKYPSRNTLFSWKPNICVANKKASIFAVTTDERKRWILDSEYIEVAQLRWLNSA